MSDTRRRLIRAARILPEAVRIGQTASLPSSMPTITDFPSTDPTQESGHSTEIQTEPAETDKLREELETLQASYDELASRLEHSESLNKVLEEETREKEAAREAEFASLKAQLEQDREAAVLAGQEEGRAQGHVQGLEEGKAETEARIRCEFETQLSETIQLLNAVHESLRANLDELLAANPYRLIRLWERVLSRLLVREVAFDQEAALRLLKELLARASEKEDIRVYLNSDDLDGVEAQKDSFGDLIRGIRNIEFLPDEEVDKGSCIVETGLGIYDARWRTQLEQISTEVETVLSEGIAHDAD